jgi:hypothetical protein
LIVLKKQVDDRIQEIAQIKLEKKQQQQLEKENSTKKRGSLTIETSFNSNNNNNSNNSLGSYDSPSALPPGSDPNLSNRSNASNHNGNNNTNNHNATTTTILGAKPEFVSSTSEHDLADPPVLSGWLRVKETDEFLSTTWKTRYLVVVRGFLYVYMDKLEIPPYGRYCKGKLCLGGFRVADGGTEKNENNNNNNKHSIRLVFTPEETSKIPVSVVDLGFLILFHLIIL